MWYHFSSMNMTIHHLQFTMRAVTPLEPGEQSGPAIRGALFNALWERFCVHKDVSECASCSLARVCSVAALVSPLRDDEQKGSFQCPRPYVVQPPLHLQRCQPGELFSFGVGLFGSAAPLFPYLIIAAQGLEQSGIGKKLAENNGQRGRVRVEQIAALNPLNGTRKLLYQEGAPPGQTPGLPIHPHDVVAHSAALPSNRLTLRFQTPLRLIDHGRLVRRICFRPLLQRLMRRLDELCTTYGEGPLNIDFHALLMLAEQVGVASDQTRWFELASHSSRRQSSTPAGGLVGQVTFVGNLAELRELLVWGSLIHVGRNAVKGDGWYVIV